MGRYRGRHAAAGHNEFTAARLRRGVSSAAVAAAAMAALTASQAPGTEFARSGGEDDGATESVPDLPPGDDSYHTELPPLRTPAPPEDDAPGPGGPGGLDESGIPAGLLAAYKQAERSLGATDPGCNLPWELLAAIGKVESGQARGGAVDDAGTTLSPIRGPQLNGEGFARIEDTDGGAYDGDAQFDRAVGPMQFIPSTWETWAADGNGDGLKDPDNIYDAALAAGAYLCHGERDLAVKADLDRAILSYNQSREYLNTVLAWLEFYRDGVHPVPDGTGVLPTSPGAGSDLGAGGESKNDGGADGDGRGDDRRGGDGRGGDGRGGDADGDGRKPTDDPSAPGGDPDGSGPGAPSDGESPEPTPEDSEDPADPTQPTDPPTEPVEDVPAVVERLGEETVTVPTGGTVTDRFKVRVSDQDGRPVPGAQVRYVISDPDDATDATFAGVPERMVTTDDQGVAAVPELTAGQRAGSFTVEAVVDGHDEVRTAFTTTVEAPPEPEPEPEPEPKADTLQRVGGDGAITAQAGEVCPDVQILATYGDEPAAHVPVTATVLNGDGQTLDAETGPYFPAQDEDGRAHARELTTDSEGGINLSGLHAGDNAGTYQLRLTTVDGGELVLTIEVAGASSPPPEPSSTPSPDSSSSPSPEPSPSSSS